MARTIKAPKGKTKGNGQLTVNQQQQLRTLTSHIASRAILGQRLGQSFAGDRDLYNIVGYPKEIEYQRYNGRYRRQDIAKRLINAYPEATWRGQPDVFESEKADETTKFEQAWKDLVLERKLFHYFNRTDKLTGIGRYGVMLLGLDDGKEWDVPVTRASNLLYVTPFSEESANILKREKDKSNPRYNLPLIYAVKPAQEELSSTGTIRGPVTVSQSQFNVHWTRIIHVAEACLSSDVFGTPRLEAVYNRLQDLELVMAGSAEMFWRGGFPGYAFNVLPDAKLPDEKALEDEIEAYLMGLNRYMRLQGMDVKALTQEIADPEKQVDTILKMISGSSGIPVRILVGSERGELASSQDENNWNRRVEERRTDFAELIMLRPFIDRMIELGVLPKPKDGYEVEWPSMDTLSEKDQSEVANKQADTLSKYVMAPGADDIIPPMQFLTEIMGFPQERAEAMLEEGLQAMIDEEKEAREAEKDSVEDDEDVEEEEQEDLDE